MSAPSPEPAGRTLAVQQAASGDHLCSFHGTPEQQRRLATAFVASALGTGDRVVYVAGEGDPAAIGRSLSERGIDAAEPLRTGQLTVLDWAAINGSATEMDVEAVRAAYRDEADRSRAVGFPGLRVAAEMDPVVDALGSVERLMDWEDAVGQTFHDAEITAVCQYDAGRVAGAAQERLVAVHTAVAIDDGTVPLATFNATEAPDELRVAGELDLSTAPVLARALRARASQEARLRVDVGGVSFIDVTALRTMFEVAEELPGGSVLKLQSAPAQLIRLLRLLRWEDRRVHLDQQ